MVVLIYFNIERINSNLFFYLILESNIHMETELFENSPEYFKNKFSNNCKMRLRYLNKLKNYFFNANNIAEQYNELEKQKDPYSKKSELFNSVYKNIKSIYENDLDLILTQVQDEFNEELSKDFSKIIDDNKAKQKKD